uniref:glycosyltransferase n=1 Tax=Actinosynnema sp. TaxID=1872144 RepID=UPI003F834011
MRVLHVTETYASGVASAVDRYVASTPDLEHHLLWSGDRADRASATPSGRFASATALPSGHLRRRAAVRATVQRLGPDVVHAHSSYAGLYVRTAVRASSCRPVVYTPHCWAFERLDLPRAARWVLRAVELALLLNTSVVAACSEGEAERSAPRGVRPRVVVVPQLAPPSTVPAQRRADHDEPRAGAPGDLTVVGAGRICAQKDPAFFASVVSAARSAGLTVRATWIGDGDPALRRVLEAADVTVTGWLGRGEVPSALARHSVYLHCAAWEGFPVTLLEAHAAGCVPLLRTTASQGRRTLPTSFST